MAWPSDTAFRVLLADAPQTPLAEYTTDPLRMHSLQVASQLASNLTQGAWSSCTSTGCEVPPDAELSLHFSSAVQADLFASAAVVECPSRGATPIRIATATACGGWYDEHCIKVTLDDALPQGEPCSLRLPAGSRYHPYSGPLGSDIVWSVHGLFDFEFDYRPAQQLSSVPSSRFLLGLRHGLAAEADAGTDAVATLEAALQVRPLPEGDIRLKQVSSTALELIGDWAPATTVTVSFDESASGVRDGFGLPFVGHTQEPVEVTLAPGVSFLLDAADSSGLVATLDPALATQPWQVLHQGKSCGSEIRAAPVTTVADVAQVLGFMGDRYNNPAASLDGTSVLRLDDAVNSVREYTLDAESLLGDSGVFHRHLVHGYARSWSPQNPCGMNHDDTFIVTTPWALHRIGDVVLVTHTDTGATLAGVNVSVLCQSHSKGSLQVTTEGSCVTTSEGMCSMSLATQGSYHTCHAVLSKGTELFVTLYNGYVRPQQQYSDVSEQHVAVVLTGRRLYQAGDSVSVKGYLRTFPSESETGSLPDSIVVRGEWRQQGPAEGRYTQVEVTVDPVYHSFEAELPIVDDAEYGVRSIVVGPVSGDDDAVYADAAGARKRQGSADRVGDYYYGGGGGFAPPSSGSYESLGQVWGSTTVVVADPRIPTAILTAQVEEALYQDADGVTLSGSVGTYVGSPIGGAEISIQWSAPIASTSTDASGNSVATRYATTASSSSDMARGSLSLTTDATGVFSQRFTLPSDVVVEQGSSIAFEFSYIGPTRELLTASDSVRVQESEYRVVLDVAQGSPVLPGHVFGVLVDAVSDAETAVPVDAEITVRFAKLHDSVAWFNASVALEAQADVVDSCTAIAGDAARVQCEFLLADVAAYVVEASIPDTSGAVARAARTIGRHLPSWSQAPLLQWSGVAFTPMKSEFADGEEVQLQVIHPFAECSLFIALGTETPRLVACPPADATAIVSVGRATVKNCGAGCAVRAVIAAPRAAHSLPAELPISMQFDPEAPVSLALQAAVQVVQEEQPFAMESELVVTPAQAQALPGDVVDVTVSGAGAEAEVHLFVIDTKVLDLEPHPIANVAASFASYLPQPYQYVLVDTVDSLLAASYVVGAAAVWLRRVTAFPWALPWQSPHQYYHYARSGVDMSDEAFYDAYAAPITDIFYQYQPVQRGGGYYEVVGDEEYFLEDGATGGGASPSAPMEMKMMDFGAGGEADRMESGGDGDAASGAVANVRGTAVYVPVSTTQVTGADGTTTFKVELPDNLSTFKLRAYAVNKDRSAYGAGEGEVVSRRAVNLEPSIPRIARVGDVFAAGTTVTAVDLAEGGSLRVTVELIPDCNNLELLTPQTKEVTLDSVSPVRVEFALHASSVGAGNLRLRVSDGSSAVLDAVDASIDVMGWQEAVTVGTSFALRADTKDGEVVGMDIPDHVPGSGSITVRAGVGRLPAVQIIAGHVLAALDTPRFRPSGIDLLAALMPATAVSVYPRESVDEVLDEYFGTARTAMSMLEEYTNPAPWSHADVGLVMYPCDLTSWWCTSSSPPEPSLRLNAYALLIDRFALGAGLDDGVGDLGGAGAGATLRQAWTVALERAVQVQVEHVRQFNLQHIPDRDGLVIAYLALGARHSFDVASADADLVSLDALLQAADELSFLAQAQLALILATDTQAADAAVLEEIISRLRDAMRTQGRTSYVARGTGSDQTDSGASAMLLATFAEAGLLGADEPEAEKLANGVGSMGEGASSGSGYYFPVTRSGLDNGFALYALAMYDRAVGSTDPHLATQAILQGSSVRLSLLEAKFTSPDDPAVQTTVSLGALDAAAGLIGVQRAEHTSKVHKEDFSTIVFDVAGTSGEVSYVTTVDFVPAVISPTPIYRGFTVNKVVRHLDPATGEAIGAAIESAEAGTQVVVTIEIDTPDDVSDVMLVDPLPGCLEPVSSGGAPTSTNGNSGDAYSYGWWWRSLWRITEAKRQGVYAHAPHMWAGSHTLEYVALVVTPGTFIMPPTKVYATMQPELLGLSGGGSFAAVPVSSESQNVLAAAEADVGAVSNGVECNEPEPEVDLYEELTALEDDHELVPPPAEVSSKQHVGDEGMSTGLVVFLVLLATLVVALAGLGMYKYGQRRSQTERAAWTSPEGGKVLRHVVDKDMGDSPLDSVDEDLVEASGVPVPAVPASSSGRGGRSSRTGSPTMSTGRHTRRSASRSRGRRRHALVN